MLSLTVAGLVACAAFVYANAQNGAAESVSLDLPSQSVFVDPKSFAVLGANGSFRTSSFNDPFNPTSTTPPFFQIFDRSFLSVLGTKPSIHAVASNDTFAFAHEAPIYNPSTDEVFFSSVDGGVPGLSDLNNNNQVSKISMKAVEAALARSHAPSVDVPVIPLNLPDTIQMVNGGTGPYKSSLLFITSGRGARPPSIALVDPRFPNNVTVILDNFFGRQFNSLNDIKVHPSGNIFFTDSLYGFINAFRPPPIFPTQVYRLDPGTSAIRVVATDFDKANGIAFTADGKIAYVSDTGSGGGVIAQNNETEPATIYAFDVDPRTQVFQNRRIFAYTDAGIPDGIQVDQDGNVYSGCGDGVQVWNNEGTLIGKFFLGMTSANMVFAGDGRLVIMAETKIFVAHIAAKEIPPVFP